MTEEKTGHVPGACAAKILVPGTKVPIVASGGYVPSVEDRLRAEIERLRGALELIARHLSSDWPEQCQANVRTARKALTPNVGIQRPVPGPLE